MSADLFNVMISLGLALEAPTGTEAALHFTNAALNCIGLISLCGNAVKEAFKYVAVCSDVLSGGKVTEHVELMLKMRTSEIAFNNAFYRRDIGTIIQK